ncbi:DNA polymerase III subunit delta [Lentilactobacillus laojiaonis]|uniref:DNA polymerase III subunit delta n=1 Tax=Lentilactobacillus laojiaonis TaxID=2883998 RepID=UPI001D09C74D|nr:DNA polymerase III subunit delta [Lentilactobacillus laojiaonis]UDM32513.1 DNA polymerase III subunit delta [Lentilactobacillus laojiaonis]
MDYQQLKDEIDHNQLAPVYLILGDQKYLSDEIKKLFISKIPEEELSMNVGVYDMEDTPIGEALNDANSISFFGDRRLVIITNPYFLAGQKVKNKIEHNLDDLYEYLSHPQESTIFLIFASYPKLDSRKKLTKLLKQNAKVVEINKMTESQIKNIILQEISKEDFTITNDALNELFILTSGNLSKIMNELPKLFLYSSKSREINIEAVKGLVSQSMEQNVFDLVNVVLEQRITKANEIYKDLLSNKEDPLKINAVLIQQFRLLIQTMILSNHGYSQGSLASVLKVHPYRITLALKTIKRFKYESLEKAYVGLVEIEKSLKTSNQSPELLFELFMFKFTNSKN